MIRFLTTILLVVIASAGIFAALAFLLHHFGWYPLLDSSGKVITVNVLEVLKLLPAFLAFAASIVTAAVSIHLVTLQNRSSRDLESFKTDLAARIEGLRMQIAISTRNLERINKYLYQIPLIRTRGPIGAVRWT